MSHIPLKLPKFLLRNKSSEKLSHSPFYNHQGGQKHILIPKKNINISNQHRSSQLGNQQVKSNQIFIEGDLSNFSNHNNNNNILNYQSPENNFNNILDSKHVNKINILKSNNNKNKFPRKSPVPPPNRFFLQSNTPYQQSVNSKQINLINTKNIPYSNKNSLNKTFHNSKSSNSILRMCNSDRSHSPIFNTNDSNQKITNKDNSSKGNFVSKSPNINQSSLVQLLQKLNIANPLGKNYILNFLKESNNKLIHPNKLINISNKIASLDKNEVKSTQVLQEASKDNNNNNNSNNNINIIKNGNNYGIKTYLKINKQTIENTSNVDKKNVISNNNSNLIDEQRNNSDKKILDNIYHKNQNNSNNPSNREENIPYKTKKKLRSFSSGTPSNFEEIMNNNQNEIKNIPKNQTQSTHVQKKIRDIHIFTHVGFDGEQDKANNQDNAFVERNFMNNPDFFYMSVCDGHGVEGHEVSAYIKKILPKEMSKNLIGQNLLSPNAIQKNTIHSIITNTFLETNNKLINNPKINSIFSGSTCVSVICTPYKLICPNIGDSRAVLGKNILNTRKWTSFNLSRDHKPSEKDEKKRIIENNGRIQPFVDEKTGEFIGPQRVWLKEEQFPGLAMTRSFGDRVAATVGVISAPEILEYEFQEEDKFMLIASDGIWEFIESEECVNIIKDYYLINDLKNCCLHLYLESKKRWIKEEEVVDDITMILVFFD